MTLTALRLYYDKKDGCKHPFGVGKVCIDCVAELLAEHEAAAVAAAYQKAADAACNEAFDGIRVNKQLRSALERHIRRAIRAITNPAPKDAKP